jgi:uncharacterized protein involved in outer membrane biogenesis
MPAVTLEASADLLDLDALLALANAFMPASTPGPSAPSPRLATLRASVRVSAPRARAAGAELSAFEAVVTAADGTVTIEPLAFDLFGGHHEGWLSLAGADTLQVRVGSSVSGIDVAQLARFGGAEGAITGTLSGTARIGAAGRELATILAAARGIGEITIDDGALPRLDLVRTVVSFLSRGAATSASGAGRFDRLAGTFALANRRVTTEDLEIEADDVDVLGRGSLDLQSKALDGRANLVLSESLSRRADQALVRYALMGDRVVLPATIGGTLARPTVGIDAAAAIKRGVASEVERRLRRFFDRVGPL